jgi:hypothetical protein
MFDSMIYSGKGTPFMLYYKGKDQKKLNNFDSKRGLINAIS